MQFTADQEQINFGSRLARVIAPALVVVGILVGTIAPAATAPAPATAVVAAPVAASPGGGNTGNEVGIGG
ncbi:hypothetical protein AB0L41_07920 [Amycolatopsis mediterranei]|uniref:hypothetical protein n=1 Tax=Amycolatopsis mediterranei TaxID=33910 RepID=UPI003430A9B1